MTYSFIKNDAGAVTVDWVVLTAALVGLGLATMSVVSGGVEDLSTDTADQLKKDNIIRTSFSSIDASHRDAIDENYYNYLVDTAHGMTNEDLAARIATESADVVAGQNSLDTFEALVTEDYANLNPDTQATLNNNYGIVNQAGIDSTRAMLEGSLAAQRAEEAIFLDEQNQRGG